MVSEHRDQWCLLERLFHEVCYHTRSATFRSGSHQLGSRDAFHSDSEEVSYYRREMRVAPCGCWRLLVGCPGRSSAVSFCAKMTARTPYTVDVSFFACRAEVRRAAQPNRRAVHAVADATDTDRQLEQIRA